ncbi:unnamed protein product [Rotaria socialis]|uniref:Transmembrane protein n=1 Tax=Rotaria socialis TaxID=392032 RepID=A0A820FNG2_9BILA|nr:unnamed protein product [Rotaria socialis]CAF3552383.1 unnamed protein product [Rotaria socialis]CAF4119693.1 unnamed protein product [Rotaria socialis]CAF4266796.1 unnamed protein product [Rotaria socialis]
MILVFRRPSFFLSDLQCNQAYVRLSNSLSINQNVREPVVKIFQYRTSESTPFRPLSSKTSKKKLNKYILITPRTILSISLLAIRSLIVALIGLVIATSERISKLNYRCSLVQEFQVIQLYVIQQMNIVHAMTQTICLLDASNNAFMVTVAIVRKNVRIIIIFNVIQVYINVNALIIIIIMEVHACQ